MSNEMQPAYGALAAGAIAGVVVGHAMNGMRGLAQDIATAREEAAIDRALYNAAEVTALAQRLARELAAAHAENAALRRALEQRQAVIDHLRNA
jgi:hypothetical protein